MLFKSIKEQSSRQLYSSAAILIFVGAWLFRLGSNFWSMLVVSSIPILLGITVFLFAVLRKKETNLTTDGTAYSPSTSQMMLLPICSFLFSIGQMLHHFNKENSLLHIVSAVFIIASFLLLIFAVPKKHKAPVIFFLVFIVFLFTYLYFFEV